MRFDKIDTNVIPFFIVRIKKTVHIKKQCNLKAFSNIASKALKEFIF